MTLIELHPEHISKGGKDFVLLPSAEFDALQEQLEDLMDHLELLEAKRDNADQPLIPYGEVRKELGLS